MRALILPGTARGTFEAPPSKSVSHRLLICGALAQGESVIDNCSSSEDLLATEDCLRALGASAVRDGASVHVLGTDPRNAVPAVLPCRESGSTLRFLLPLCLLSGNVMRLEGSSRLMERPLSVYADLCRAQGLRFEQAPDGVTVAGRLHPGEYTVPGDTSSQFVTGLLFALTCAGGESVIRVTPPLESGSYLDLTLDALRTFGADARRESEYVFRTGGRLFPRRISVEGDWSNAAFFFALNALGSDVRITGLRTDSLQGDRICLRYLALLSEGTPELDLSDCPDLAPVLIAAAAALHGAVFTSTRRLRFKESDRGLAMAVELEKLGVILHPEEDRILVPAGELRRPQVPLDGHNDHRIVMALAVLLTLVGGEIEGAQAVRKSFPDFWERLCGLGVTVRLD